MGSYRERIDDIAERLGVEFGVPTADRARDVARVFVEDMELIFQGDGDEDELVGVVSEGVSSVLRSKHSGTRRSTMNAMMARLDDTVKGTVSVADPVRQQHLPVVDFPITVQGEKTVRIGNASCVDIRSFIRLVDSQKRGLERTSRFCENLIPLWDGQDESHTLDELVTSGAVTLSEIEQAIQQA